MNKKTVTPIILILIIFTCVATFGACVKDEVPSRPVKIEIINPNTGEVLQSDDVIDLPKEETPIEVRVKDKETGVYLTDDDLPGNTVIGSCNIIVWLLDTKGHHMYIVTHNNWPIEDDNVKTGRHRYKIVVDFDCRPKEPKDPKKFQRRYSNTMMDVSFYSSKYSE